MLARSTTSGLREFENRATAMEIVNCSTHGKPCVLKTGIKQGPSHGLSFYICTQESGQCKFVKQTSLKPKSCPSHPSHLVELQSVVTSKSSNEQRCYYRCSGREAGQKWCGFFLYGPTSKKSPLKDFNHQNPKHSQASSDGKRKESPSNPPSSGQVPLPAADGGDLGESTKHRPEQHQDSAASQSSSSPTDAADVSMQSISEVEKSPPSLDGPESQQSKGSPLSTERRSTLMSLDDEDAPAESKPSKESPKNARKMPLMSVGEVFEGSEEVKEKRRSKPEKSPIHSLSVTSCKQGPLSKPPVANLFPAGKREMIDLTSDDEEDLGTENVSMVDESLQQKLHSDSFRTVQTRKPIVADEDEEVESVEDSFADESSASDSELHRKLQSQSFRQMRDVAGKNDDDDDDLDSGKELFESSDEEIYEDALSEPVRSTKIPEPHEDSSPKDRSAPSVPNSATAAASKSELLSSKNQPPEGILSTNQAKQPSELEEALPALSLPKTASSRSDKPSDFHTASSLPAPSSQLAPRVLASAPSGPRDVQTGLTQSLTKLKVSGAKGGVSASQTGPSLKELLAQRKKAADELAKDKHIIAMVSLSSLPDKGARLKGKVEQLEDKLKTLDQMIQKQRQAPSQARPAQEVRVFPGGLHLPQGPRPQSARPPQVTAMYPGGKADPPSAATGGSLPSQPPPWMYAAYNMPAHMVQQLYADNPQAMTLYGGRMTASRLREVGSVTREAIDSLHKQLESCPPATAELEDPSGLKVPLMTHQRQALAWLSWRERQNPPGGILADDMGLGKTLTMISLVLKQRQMQESGTEDEKKAWLSREKQLSKLGKGIVRSRATLVVCPASLVHQWNKEIEKRCYPGRLQVCLYHGQNRERNLLRLADNDVVLTTYNLVAREVGAPKTDSAENPVHEDSGSDSEERSQADKEKEPNILRIAWKRIVLDEAHNVKNHKSLMSMAVSRLRANFRWALTGTPIQNDLLDMYALLRFLRCSPFDEYKVWKRHVDTGKGTGAARLNTLVKALLLRRTKDQLNAEGKPLVSLPSKTTQIHEIELAAEERKIYDQLFAKTRLTVVDYINRHQEHGPGTERRGPSAPQSRYPAFQPASALGSQALTSGQGVGGVPPVRPRTTFILVLLLRLRQCCSHLSLMKEHLESESLETEGIELTLEEQMKGLGLEELDSKDSRSVTASAAFQKSAASSKLQALMDKIREVKENSRSGPRQKCVVVSQWTKMLEIVAVHLHEAGISHDFIQGSVTAKKRSELVEEFNHKKRGPDVMLVSLRAGGVGLNLIGANHLFLMDSHWNPALEDQACDRIYRMGQDRDVFIHRFLCKDTIEEKIVQLQTRKLDLAKNVLSGGETKSQKLTLDDLRLLFGV